MKNRNKRIRQILTKKFLKREYILNKKSIIKIAKKVGCGIATVVRYLEKFNIKRRKPSEYKGKETSNYKDGRCLKIYYCIDCKVKIDMDTALYGQGRCSSCASKIHSLKMKGKGHPNWQNGITPLNSEIRSLSEYNQWRKQVFKRDNYTCQECGDDTGGNLEAHHKTQFAKLLQEFLQEYNQFSPIEDKETLVRLAMKWQPFWNIDNGETLCGDCHKQIKIIKGFKKSKKK